MKAEIKTMTEVVNVKKKYLNKAGYMDFQHWIRDPNNVYIGRNLSFYSRGYRGSKDTKIEIVGSKWGNPFRVKKYGREECLKMYEEYIRNDSKTYDGKTLYQSLDELEGKTLGCWCHPDPCHGHVLLKILRERRGKVEV
ncbi:hypothetical protein FSP39_004528 [Pinctada imbricata]|uniref:DUF4326 domain-containing protein n=1 Tax=Pinctada imbricata TaxID=66713 RepID=A0AA88XYY1_PINIB|nr:hypothetical protein FSP39_004528 [Pinctada imbricata]